MPKFSFSAHPFLLGFDVLEEMLERSATKVKDSAQAAQFLHSDAVLHEADQPRGRFLLDRNRHRKEQDEKE